MAFQSFDVVRRYLEFRDQLQRESCLSHVARTLRLGTHSILVRGFTCPSSHLIAFFESMSQINADPWCWAVAMNLPEGSKRANIAFAEREVCTAVGYCIVRGSVRSVEIESLSIRTNNTH